MTSTIQRRRKLTAVLTKWDKGNDINAGVGGVWTGGRTG
jgi:hypothetical protein